MSHPSHTLPLYFLSGNVSLCSVFGSVSLLRFHSTMTPQILSAMLPSYWGIRGSSMPKVRGAHNDMHAHNLAHFFELSSTCKLTHTYTHTTFVHNTAHSLRRCWWIRHLELADKEKKWGRAAQRRKKPKKRARKRFSEAAGRNWKEDPGRKK